MSDFVPNNQPIQPNQEQGTMTITKNVPNNDMQAMPQANMIESFVKKDKPDDVQDTLTVTFTVLPKGDQPVHGVQLMNAVLKACDAVGADLITLSIKRDEKK